MSGEWSARPWLVSPLLRRAPGRLKSAVVPALLACLLGLLACAGSPAAAQSALLQINCAGPAVSPFVADTDFSGGSTHTFTNSVNTNCVTNAAPMAVYQTVRSSSTSFSYNLPNFTAGATYRVRLHFSENYYTSANQRLFNIAINGQTVVSNLDVFASAGAMHALVLTYTVQADSNGKINITFTTVKNGAFVCGIEVLQPQIFFPNDYPAPSWALGVNPLDGSGAGDAGPSSTDSVNLASGVYENHPGPDVVVRNPNGPSPIFERMYRSSTAYYGYSSPGLSLGWTHNYDVTVCGASGSWDALTLMYPNGAAEWLSPKLNTSGVPTGYFDVPPGAPYQAKGVASSTVGQWTSLTLTFKDLSQWTFTPDPNVANHYLLTQITNIAGHYITIGYDSHDELSTVYDDSPTPRLLMSCDYQGYGNSGYLYHVYDNSDPNNTRVVAYGVSLQSGVYSLSTVSNLYLFNNPVDNATVAQYYYAAVGGKPFLAQVTVPDPSSLYANQHNQISYNPNTGQVTSLLDANGNQHLYTYSLGTLVQIEDNTGKVALSWTQNSDMFDRDIGSTDANSNTDYIYYRGSPWLPTNYTNRNGQTTTVGYDLFGNVTTLVVPANGSLLTTSCNYDSSHFAFGQLKRVQEGSKTPTTFNYYYNNTVNGVAQPNGSLNTVQTPDPSNPGGTVTTTYVYTALGNIASVTGPAPQTGVNTTITYNYTSDPLDGTTKTEALGEPLTVTVPINSTQSAITHYRYDNFGNVTAVIDPNGCRTDIFYNTQNQVTDVYYPLESGPTPMPASLTGRIHVHYNYHYNGGPLWSVQLFDENGNLFRTVNRTNGFEDETLALSGDTDQASATYDPLYRSKSLADGDGSTHALGYQYDKVGNLSLQTFPNYTQSNNFDGFVGGYDANYNLTSRIDGLNRTTTYQLDNGPSGDDRLLKVIYPSGTLPNVSFVYDGYDRLTQRTDGAGVVTYSYNDLDQLLNTTITYNLRGGGGTLPTQTISYTYYPDGSRHTMTTPVGVYSYTYDLAGRLTDVAFPWSGGSAHYDYDAGGRLLHVGHSKGDTTYTYDNLGRLLDLKNTANTQGNPVMSEFGPNITYDASGDRLNIPIYIIPQQAYGITYDAGGQLTYTYNDTGNQDQLASETRQMNFDGNNAWGQYPGYYQWTFTSDAADNLSSGRVPFSTYNLDNQMQWGNGYPYDGEGNFTQVGAFDIENRLSLDYPYPEYTDDGLRAWRLINHGITPIYFLYDGAQVLCELSSTGQVVGAYGYGAGGLLQRFDGANYTTYTFDPQGTVVSRFRQPDAANQPQDIAVYDAFGKLLGDLYLSSFGVGDATPVDPVGYCGQWGCYSDADTTGLVLMGYRYYDPYTCRFITRDPLGTDGGMNPYAYCRNNPVNCVDPLGLQDNGFVDKLRLWGSTVLEAGKGLVKGVINGSLGSKKSITESLLIPNEQAWRDFCNAPDTPLFPAGNSPVEQNAEGFGRVAAFVAMIVTPGAAEEGATKELGIAVDEGLPEQWGPYSHLEDPPTVGPGKRWTKAQYAKIYAENRARNGGVLRCDETGEILVESRKSMKGVTPPPNEAQVDHIRPRVPSSPHEIPGSNSYKNARVISRRLNRAKSNR